MSRRAAPRQERPARGEQIEGRQAVRELLVAGKRRVHRVMISGDPGDQGVLSEIAGLARRSGVPVRTVERSQLMSAAQTDAPQGVIATADPVPEADLEELCRPLGGTAPFLVVLDGVTDPHNLGAVMRSAASAGSTGMVIGRHRAAGLTPAAVKAAAGAAEHLRVATVSGIPNSLSAMKAAGVWTVALDATASGSIWDLRIASEPVALVLGSEGKGVSRLARDRCDLAVAIPMPGPLGSLNVSAAAALACFEVARRRMTTMD